MTENISKHFRFSLNCLEGIFCIYVLFSVSIIRHFTEQLKLVQCKLKYMK